MFLLDTNVLRELRKASAGKADPHVVAWLSAQDAASFYISSVTLMELDLGILLLERRDPGQGARLRAWMDAYVLPEFSERTVSVDRPSRCAAPVFMCRILARNATPSSRPAPSSTA